MGLLQDFQNNIFTKDLFSKEDKLLIAVSGGVDSVVLCELCRQSGLDFIIAHCNFMLRIPESQRDESFVRELDKKFNTEVYARAFKTEEYANEKKLSIQEAAREIRYKYFDLLIGEGYATIILTAHHADDNIETAMMNFFRGTGPQGLAGIPEKIRNIRRPLLPFRKDQLIEFAKENKLDYVEDSSNSSSKYTRNYFRNELIPGIEKVFPRVKDNIQDNINRFKEIGTLYELMTNELIRKLGRKKGNEFHIPVKQLAAYNNRALIYAVIYPYGFTGNQIDEVVKLISSESGKHISSSSHHIIKNRAWLIITPITSTQSETIIIEDCEKEFLFALGNLALKKTSNLPVPPGHLGGQPPRPTGSSGRATSNNLALLDSKEIRFPLLLRPWKEGDYFYPLGMKKKKKLARFLIDNKLSKTEKQKIWVVESDKRILWVIGHRIDERFKITENTKSSLQLNFTPTT